jgi:hypothetical protein
MFAGDGLTSADTTTSQAASGLIMTGVDCFQTMEALAEFRRKTLVGQGQIGKQCVTTTSRTIEKVEEGSSRGLVLESDV